MQTDRSAYPTLPLSERIVKAACPKCGGTALNHGGTHDRMSYFACDLCRVKFKARVSYVERRAEYFRQPEATPNAS